MDTDTTANNTYKCLKKERCPPFSEVTVHILCYS